jgi:hypothetical protein
MHRPYKCSFGKPEGKTPFWILRHICEDKIRVLGFGGDVDKRRALLSSLKREFLDRLNDC